MRKILLIGLFAVVFLLSSLSVASTDLRPWIPLVYEHSFFIQKVLEDSEVWVTEESAAWSRWTFTPKNPYEWRNHPDLWPLKMQVETKIPIDLDIWHNPPPIKVDPAVYLWQLQKEVTFSMEPRMKVDPGVHIARQVTPERIPPGVSDVKVKVSFELVREPTINGIPMRIMQGRMGVYAHQRWLHSEIEILKVTPISPQSSHCWSLPEYWGNIGCGTGFGEIRVGQTRSISLIMTLKNLTSHDLIVRPTVALNLYGRRYWFSREAGLSLASPSLEFALHGPVGEELQITISTRDGESLVDWDYSNVKGHGTIWLWWPDEVKELSQRFYFYYRTVIQRKYPSYFVHGFADVPMPKGEDPEEFCAVHYTFEAWIDGTAVTDVELNSKTKPHPQDENLLLLDCLYRKDFPSNYFSIGEHQLRGKWCSDLIAEPPFPSCMELIGTLIVR